jgi:hypothetical protein
LNTQDFNGFDALYYCVCNDSVKSLKTIIELAHEQINPDWTYGKKKRNLLAVACLYSTNKEIIDILINNGLVKFNANHADRLQRNCIFYAVFRNKIEYVKILLQNSECLLDIPDLSGMCVIDYAWQFNYEDILLEIIKGGARLGVMSQKGVEIMHFAA